MIETYISEVSGIWRTIPDHAQYFLVAILVVTFAFHIRFTPKTVANGPAILTTTGIFATFLGIAVGLSEFDTTNVQASVPSLLAGLKTAFWASVAGVGGALTLKFRDHLVGPRQSANADDIGEEVTAADLARQLSNIHRALAGSEDGSLISQMKLSRQDSNDRLDGLKAAQLEALQKLSDMGSKTLVEALRDVIRDFNSKISEQFGDNFKELNSAVAKLLEWQERYRQHVDSSAAALSEITQLTAKSAEHYASFVDHSSQFSKVATDLKSLLTTLNAEKERLTIVSGELARLLQAASGSLPEVERKIVDMSNQVAQGMAQHQRIVGQAVADNSAALKAAIDDVARDLSQITATTREHVSALEERLGAALEESLNSLGRQLTALSQAFVEDYTPLTERLRAVVRMAP